MSGLRNLGEEQAVTAASSTDAAAGDGSDDGQDPGDGGLLSRLKLIEDQPLETRAEAYGHVHEELREALDAADRQGGR